MNPSEGNDTTLPNPGESTHNSLGYRIAEYVIIILGFSANSFICFAFAYYRRIRTVNNYFVVNLAISDMMLLLVLCIWKATQANLKTLREVKEYMLFLIIFEVFCSTASIVSLTVLSYDRFLSVTKPLHYTTFITGRKALLVIAYIWFHSAVIALLGLTSELPNKEVFKFGYTPLLAFCNLLLPLAITLYCYIKIFLIASRHLRHNPHQNQGANETANILTKNLKIAFHILVLVAPLLMFWTAFYTISVVEIYCRKCIFCKNCITTLQDWIISNMGSILGSVDPIIYIFLTKDYRKIFFSCFERNNRPLFVSETFHLSATKATTTQASPVSYPERRFPEMWCWFEVCYRVEGTD